MRLEKNGTGSLEYFGENGHVCASNMLFRPVFLKLGSAEPRGSAKWCQRFRETKLRNGGQVLLTVLNLYVRIKIRLATFDTNHSVADITQTIAALIQKLPVSTARH